MIKIELNNASNGVIKRVIDTQYNGVDEQVEIVTLYEMDPEDKLQYYLKLMDLLLDVSKDLGLYTGSDYAPDQIKFSVDWGDKYEPTLEEIDDKIKMFREEIRDLKRYKKMFDDNVSDI